MKAAKKADLPSAEVPWENPLIPNKRLRELYTSMAEVRLLEEHVAKLRRRTKASNGLHVAFGEEACRVSTALSLLPGDLTSDITPSASASLLRGSKLTDVIRSVDVAARTTPDVPGQLPVTKDPSARLHLAIGAALALAARKKGPLVLAYLYPDELASTEWKPVFRLAARSAAPVIFVSLPTPASARAGKLSELSTSCGVPGIPVDAADAVALYRVVQESMLRARAGGGPVLMECVRFQLPGTKSSPADPVQNMRESLIHRKIADDAWFQTVATRFASRLKAVDL